MAPTKQMAPAVTPDDQQQQPQQPYESDRGAEWGVFWLAQLLAPVRVLHSRAVITALPHTVAGDWRDLQLPVGRLQMPRTPLGMDAQQEDAVAPTLSMATVENRVLLLDMAILMGWVGYAHELPSGGEVLRQARAWLLQQVDDWLAGDAEAFAAAAAVCADAALLQRVYSIAQLCAQTATRRLFVLWTGGCPLAEVPRLCAVVDLVRLLANWWSQRHHTEQMAPTQRWLVSVSRLASLLASNDTGDNERATVLPTLHIHCTELTMAAVAAQVAIATRRTTLAPSRVYYHIHRHIGVRGFDPYRGVQQLGEGFSQPPYKWVVSYDMLQPLLERLDATVHSSTSRGVFAHVAYWAHPRMLAYGITAVTDTAAIPLHVLHNIVALAACAHPYYGATALVDMARHASHPSGPWWAAKTPLVDVETQYVTATLLGKPSPDRHGIPQPRQYVVLVPTRVTAAGPLHAAGATAVVSARLHQPPSQTSFVAMVTALVVHWFPAESKQAVAGACYQRVLRYLDEMRPRDAAMLLPLRPLWQIAARASHAFVSRASVEQYALWTVVAATAPRTVVEAARPLWLHVLPQLVGLVLQRLLPDGAMQTEADRLPAAVAVVQRLVSPTAYTPDEQRDVPVLQWIDVLVAMGQADDWLRRARAAHARGDNVYPPLRDLSAAMFGGDGGTTTPPAVHSAVDIETLQQLLRQYPSPRPA